MKYLISMICIILVFNINSAYSQDNVKKNFTPIKDVDNIPARITRLEKRVNNLEERVAELENLLHNNEETKRSETILQTDKWENKSNWRKLEKGMNKNEVRNILGEPYRIVARNFEYWFYAKDESEAYLTFYNGLVDAWVEP